MVTVRLSFAAGVCPASLADGSLDWKASSSQLKFHVRLPQGAVIRKLSQFPIFPTIFKTRWVEGFLTSSRCIHASSVEHTGEYDEKDEESSLPAVELLEDTEGRRSSMATAGRVAQRDIDSVNLENSIRLPEEGYVGLFVRMLGLDHPAEDREQAVKALWRHSIGGARFVDQIVEFPGTLTLIVSLLPSDRSAASEAAAGLLRNISALNAYRGAVAEAGAVEEITGILTRREIPPEVREQATGCLWNLSVDKKIRRKIQLPELLPVLVAMLDSEGLDREAASGFLANVALDKCNLDTLVEAGVIPKLAKLLRDGDGSKVTRREARNCLLELAKDDLHKLTIIEEGLVPVPLVGASAYQSFKPLLDVAPTLLNESKFEPSASLPSAFGARKLLLGLNIGSNELELDDASQTAIEGRARQHFLGRIGLLEKETGNAVVLGDQAVKKADKFTIMPWWDGIARLVLILGLEDKSVASLAARTISEIAINEEIRQAIQKAGSIPHLVRLLGSGDEAATEGSASALERLAISFNVRRSIEAHGAVPALVEVLKADGAPDFVKDKVLMALARLLQSGGEVRDKVQAEAFPGLSDIASSGSASLGIKEEAQEILEEVSMRNVDSRDMIIKAYGVPALVAILASEAPFLKEKAACVLDNLVVKEQHAEAVVNAEVELSLKSLLELKWKEGESGSLDTRDIINREETWAVVAAASRLLNKLFAFEIVRSSVDCKSFAVLLANILKSDAPLHIKDWVSACLLKLDRLAGIATNVSIPIELEVTLHDKIPKLVNEIGTPDSVVQERAVIQLRDLVSQGVEDYVVAISDLGGIFPLVDILHKGTPRARDAALSVLYNIGMNDENHPALLRSGVVMHLQRLIRSEKPQSMLALYLLRALPT